MHPHNLKEKTKIIIEHFREHTRHKIGGKAKAMLVTSSRLHAVRYYQHIAKYIKEKGYSDLGILIAFTGETEELTEASMNKFADTETAEKFKNDEYKILIVAEKYQTGFDEPLLHTMYVDKKLGDVKAVQTLSRLNRKRDNKDSTFVLDFVNSAVDIQEAFKPYYIETEIEEETDPNTIYDIKTTLDDFRVYYDEEVSAFAKEYFEDTKDYGVVGKFEPYLKPSVDKFDNILSEEEQSVFKAGLKKFRRLYSFLSHIIRLDDGQLHEFDAFAKHLSNRLKTGDYSPIPYLNDEVEQISNDMARNRELIVHANNPMEAFKIVFDNHTLSTAISRLDQNEKFITQYIEDKSFREDINNVLASYGLQ